MSADVLALHQLFRDEIVAVIEAENAGRRA
jgi:hypothetical protein